MEPSYASGTSSTPLLGDTIGDNLDRTIARFGDREALVSVHQDLRYTYAQFGEAVDRCARARSSPPGIEPGDRVGIWSPNCAEWALVQYATAKAGIILVNINPAYRTSELAYVLNQSGCRMLVAATAFKTSDYVQMVDDVRGDCEALERVVFIGRDWEEFIAGGERVQRRRAGASARPRPSSTTRSTSSTRAAPPASRRARRSATTTSSTTATSSARGCGYTRGGPGLHPGALLPLLRHGHGQPRLHVARRVHGHPGAGVRPGRDAAGRPGRALHEPLRRADDVHRRARAPGVRRVRPVVAAHRDHGRLAVPDRDDEALRGRDAHGGGHDLLRHDRDLAGVDADGRRRPAREARRHRRAACTRTSRSRSSRPRPARSWRAASPASCARAATA